MPELPREAPRALRSHAAVSRQPGLPLHQMLREVHHNKPKLHNMPTIETDEEKECTILLMLRHRTKVSTIRVPMTIAYEDTVQTAILIGFAAAAGVKVSDVLFDILHPGQCIKGVYYEWGLESAAGGWFEVFQLPHNRKADVKDCANELRRNRDITRLSFKKLGPWVTFSVSLPDGTTLMSDDMTELRENAAQTD